jgi:hypothetical protein
LDNLDRPALIVSGALITGWQCWRKPRASVRRCALRARG